MHCCLAKIDDFDMTKKVLMFLLRSLLKFNAKLQCKLKTRNHGLFVFIITRFQTKRGAPFCCQTDENRFCTLFR